MVCKYKFQDKEKFNGLPYCTFFNEYCEDVAFICDTNCKVYALENRLEELETLLNRCEQHNKEIVKQNQSLQSELRFANYNNQKDDSYITELEESNMILQKENEKLKNKLQIATEALKKIIKIHKDDTSLKWIQELQQALEQIGAEK